MRNLFRTFNSLLCPPSTAAHHFYNSWRLCHFFSQTKLEQSVTSSHLHTHTGPPTNHIHCSNSHLLLLSPHRGGSIQTSPLQPSYNMSSWPNPLSPSPSNLSHTLTGTNTHYQHISPHWHLPHSVKQARVTPLLKKLTLNTSRLENYRPVSLLPFVAKTLERVVFNQLSLFLSQYNKLDAKQSGFRSGHSTETALLSVTEACESQRPIPNHQSSFCWIFLLLFDTCQSSDPPVHPLIAGHHWDSTSLVWILSHR